MEIEKYTDILQAAFLEIKTARTNIARQVNTAAISVYWNLGKLLSEKKIEKGHGAGVINQLSVDLKSEFPDMGLSPRNLWDMKRFYEHYKNASPKLRQCVAVLPWRQNVDTIDLHLTTNLTPSQGIFMTDNIGASLKDLGKKWFAFSKMDVEVFGVLDKINHKK